MSNTKDAGSGKIKQKEVSDLSYKLIDIRHTILKHPTRKWKTRTYVDRIFVHTTASDNQDPNHTARYHITPGPQNHLSKQGAPSIAYHDFIDKDGNVYHCNDYASITWHTKGSNDTGIGVTMAFKGQDRIPPYPEQYEALKKHLVILCLYTKILPSNVFGHREAPGYWFKLDNGSVRYKKECPGMAVDLDALRNEVTRRLQKRLMFECLYAGPIDGQFGPNSQAALSSFVPRKHNL